MAAKASGASCHCRTARRDAEWSKMPQFFCARRYCGAAGRPDPTELLQRLLIGRSEPLLHVHHEPAPGVSQPWPNWVPAACAPHWPPTRCRPPDFVRSGPARRGVPRTAPGSSLAYQLPVLTHLLQNPRGTAPQLSPTKAFGVDQVWSVDELGLKGIRPASPDGGTPSGEREWVHADARRLHEPGHGAPLDAAQARPLVRLPAATVLCGRP